MRRIVAVFAVVVGLTAACGGDTPSGPPQIEAGRDMCTACNMIISEIRFAAGYRDADGDASVFDDISCMVKYGTTRGVLDDVTAWVHDYNSKEWIDAVDAWFVRGDVETPMGSGIVAFDREAEATEMADANAGEVLRWKDLVSQQADHEG